MHNQRAQPHGKITSYSTQTISGSAQSKGGHRQLNSNKHRMANYSQVAGPVNTQKPYKVYQPPSSKGESMHPNFYSPHSKKTREIHPSNTSEQTKPRENVPGMVKFSHRATPRKHSQLGRGLSGINRSESNKQINMKVGTKSHTDSETSGKYSFQNRQNGASRMEMNGSEKHSMWRQSRHLDSSLVKTGNKTVFASNGRQGNMFMDKVDNRLVQNVHKNQFRPGGRMGEVYKGQIKTVNPVKLQYTSNKNVYSQLGSNSFPKKFEQNKSNSHRDNLRIREINPFKKKPELYSMKRFKAPELAKEIQPNSGNQQWNNHTPRESKPISETRKFQLGKIPFQNVYENRRYSPDLRAKPAKKNENPYAFQNVLGSKSINSNYSQSEVRKSNSRINSAPKYYKAEDGRNRSRSNSHTVSGQYSRDKKNDPASFLSSQSFSRNQPRTHFNKETESTENENFYVNIRKMRGSTERNVRRKSANQREIRVFRILRRVHSQWAKIG